MYRPSRTRGFALIDLVVTMICCGIVAGIALPIVNKTRLDADTRACAEKIRKIASATHNYHDAFKRLPPSTLGARGAVPYDVWHDLTEGEESSYRLNNQNTSSLALIAPFMGLGRFTDLCDPFAFDARRSLPENFDTNGELNYRDFRDIVGLKDLAGNEVENFYCPADNLSEAEPEKIIITTQPILRDKVNEGFDEDMAHQYDEGDEKWATGYTNYIANGGAGAGDCHVDSGIDEKIQFAGPMYSRTKARLETIVDGTSNTVMFGETLGQIEDGTRTQVHSWALGGQARGRGNLPWLESVHPDNEDVKVIGNETWSSAFGYGSKHPGGALFARCDGSVAQYDSEIEIEIFYQLLGTKDGNPGIDVMEGFDRFGEGE